MNYVFSGFFMNEELDNVKKIILISEETSDASLQLVT